MAPSLSTDANVCVVAPKTTVDAEVLGSPGDGGNAHSPHLDSSTGSSPGHPLVVDLSEERISIPDSLFNPSLEPEVVSSRAKGASETTPLLVDKNAFGERSFRIGGRYGHPSEYWEGVGGHFNCD